jgi:hypothetical protein
VGLDFSPKIAPISIVCFFISARSSMVF